MKTNKKPCKTLRQFDFDIGPGTTESVVEGYSTFDLVQGKALSIVTRHSSWYNGKRSRL
jgi:hypothetical protein